MRSWIAALAFTAISGCNGNVEECWIQARAQVTSIVDVLTLGEPLPGGMKVSEVPSRRAALRDLLVSCRDMGPNRTLPVFAETSQTFTEIDLAIVADDAAMVARLLPSINSSQPAASDVKQDLWNGYGLLHLAAAAESVAVARVLFAANHDVNAIGRDGMSPLHVANARTPAGEEILSLLLARGADMEMKDASGLSPLAAAVMRSDVAKASILLGKGADLDSTDFKGVTPRSRLCAATGESLRSEFGRRRLTVDCPPADGGRP